MYALLFNTNIIIIISTEMTVAKDEHANLSCSDDDN